jgi:predicted AAA+ superfamily ATPase
VESTVGAHLINTATNDCEIQYWRESPVEVDFVLTNGRKTLAIEVKSGAKYATPKGLEVFVGKFKEAHSLIIGEGGVSLPEFLSHPAEYWLLE